MAKRHPVFIHKVMLSGNALRVSIPRLIQRHLGIRAGDFIVMEPQPDGKILLWRIDVSAIAHGRERPDTNR